MSEVGGLWKHPNNPACTRSVRVFIILKLDNIWKKKSCKGGRGGDFVQQADPDGAGVRPLTCKAAFWWHREAYRSRCRQHTDQTHCPAPEITKSHMVQVRHASTRMSSCGAKQPQHKNWSQKMSHSTISCTAAGFTHFTDRGKSAIFSCGRPVPLPIIISYG